MPEVKVKTITHKTNGNKPEENSSGFDPLYGGSGENILIFPRDKIKPWWEDEETKELSKLLEMQINGQGGVI